MCLAFCQQCRADHSWSLRIRSLFAFSRWMLLVVVICSCEDTTTDDHKGSRWKGLQRHLALFNVSCIYTHTHTRSTALCPGLPRWASTRKVKPIWILLKQETVSGSGFSWVVCKSASRSRQITMPEPHHLVFHRPDAFSATQSTASKHWTYIYILQGSYVTS